ncbi:hypothetical protein NGUA15_02867 [Salmonella enterica]|nr:hypothetical protein NGUA15_02867 [Salmonella enterica]
MQPFFFLKQRVVRLCNTLHQPLVFLLALLEIVNIFNLSNKIERLIVFMPNQRDGQQRPDDIAVAGVVAFFHGIAIDVAAHQHV